MRERWTAEEISAALHMRARGLTAQQIADRLHGRTRNAVIGMLDRHSRGGAMPLAPDKPPHDMAALDAGRVQVRAAMAALESAMADLRAGGWADTADMISRPRRMLADLLRADGWFDIMAATPATDPSPQTEETTT